MKRRLYAASIAALLALWLNSGTVLAANPVDSNSALSDNGGGCFSPPIVQASPFDMLPAVNPEWAPAVNGSVPFSMPVLAHGTVVDSHISQDDFPAGHVHFDQNTDIALDAGDSGLLATGNLATSTLELEWETGSYPSWAWAGPGDRIVALGRWIFDCGHPDPIPGHKAGTNIPCLTIADQPAGVPCVGAVFNYRSEMHPPQAVAVIRSGKAARIGNGRAVPVTQADVFVSPDGGGAGDLCVVTHKTSLPAILGAPCFPLSAPLALIPVGGVSALNSRDFEFDVPLPAVPGGRNPVLRVFRRDATPVPANVNITPMPGGFHVKVLMTQPVGGHLPTGFAATVLAGFLQAPASPMVHIRVTLDGVMVNDALKVPLPGVAVPAGWKMQANVNGEWQEANGLDRVDASSTGQFVAAPIVFDEFIPQHGGVTLHVDAASTNCVDTLFGQSLLTDLIRFGFNPADQTTLPAALQLGLTCLGATERNAGSIDVSFGAPTFGVSDTSYAVTSSKGAYTLVFRIERVEDDGS